MAQHASPNCACGTNEAGQRYVDPICAPIVRGVPATPSASGEDTAGSGPSPNIDLPMPSDHCCGCDRPCAHSALPRWCAKHTDAPGVATLDDWKAAYWRMQQEFAAETLRASKLFDDLEAARAQLAEVTRERDQAQADLAAITGPNAGTGVGYGHIHAEIGWIGEPRGINYASSKRRYWTAEPEPIQWDELDHDRPIRPKEADRG